MLWGLREIVPRRASFVAFVAPILALLCLCIDPHREEAGRAVYDL